MFGAWRLLLALLVVLGHLHRPWWPASWAVFSFYVISGYLMSLILDETYGWTGAGRRRFALNRFLRASFSYDGRAPADAPTLHTVRMQLSAVF